MFAVVQHDQQMAAGQLLRQYFGRWTARLFGQAECGGDGLGEQRLVAKPIQLHQPDAVGKGVTGLPGDRQREAGLADPAHPGQGHQAGRRQQPSHPGDVAAATHEARRLRR